MSTTNELIALCHEFRPELDALRVGRIAIRVQDHGVLTFEVTRELRRGYEIKFPDLVLDRVQTVVYNTANTSVTTP
jgi:hypothetical protein